MNINDVITDGTAKFVVRSKNILDTLNLIFPIGCLHLTVAEGTPFSQFGFGEWKLVGQNKCLWGGGTDYVAGQTIDAGLPNITGKFGYIILASNPREVEGAIYVDNELHDPAQGVAGNHKWSLIGLDASKSNTIYGASDTVQPPAYVVYMWQRIA